MTSFVRPSRSEWNGRSSVGCLVQYGRCNKISCDILRGIERALCLSPRKSWRCQSGRSYMAKTAAQPSACCCTTLTHTHAICRHRHATIRNSRQNCFFVGAFLHGMINLLWSSNYHFLGRTTSKWPWKINPLYLAVLISMSGSFLFRCRRNCNCVWLWVEIMNGATPKIDKQRKRTK